MNPPNKRPIVYSIRVFPPGCGTPSNASQSNFPDKCNNIPSLKNIDHDLDAAPKAKGPSPKHETKSQNSVSDRFVVRAHEDEGSSSSSSRKNLENRDQSNTIARAKVLEVLRDYKQVFEQLSRDKEARRGGDLFNATARIDLQAQAVLENTGKVVNSDKRIGSVPGIEVEDVLQYKTELRVIGLHSKTMCGIDYMKIGDDKFATSIVAYEGYGYDDKFGSDVVIYTGEGGNVIQKGKQSEDQKLLKGNLALANSMDYKKQVRVIRGEERLDRKGKRYVYDGLYLVDSYKLEKVKGKDVYKFKLCKIPGQ